MPASSAASLLSPVALDRLPELLRRRGVAVSLKRLQEAAAAGLIPVRRVRGHYAVDDADLGEVERYFRENPPGTPRGGAAGLARAGRR